MGEGAQLPEQKVSGATFSSHAEGSVPAWEVKSHPICMATKKPLLGVIVRP